MTLTFPTSEDLKSSVRKLSQTSQNFGFKKKQTILSVSILNGRFKALSIVKDSIDRAWEHPGRVHSPLSIQQAVQDALHHTQFPGDQISILIEDSRFIVQTLQLPPMPKADLLPVLERKVEQEKSWDGPAAWRYRLGLEARGKRTVHLEIWPQHVVDTLAHICQDLGLYLRQLAPLSALSESQLSGLPVEPGEASLLVTVLEGRITFVAGRDDGSLLWTRHLSPTQDWVPLGRRVGTEVNRTIMFITQQTNLIVSTVWFLGEEERLTIQEIQPHLPTPVLPCPVSPDWKYWLWVGATLPIDHPSNFTPPEVLRAPLNNMLSKSLVASLALFLLVGVGTIGLIEGYLWKKRAVVQTTTAHHQSLKEEQGQWNRKLVALQQSQLWVQAIDQDNQVSIEGSFLGYLGNVIPSHIILQKAGLSRMDHGWTLELTGITSLNLTNTLHELDQLAKQLEEGPFHVRLEKEWRNQLLTQPANSSSENSQAPIHRFTLKGRLS